MKYKPKSIQIKPIIWTICSRQFFVFLVFLALASPLVRCAESSGTIRIINPSELQNTKNITLLDCRSKSAFRQGRIPGSQHVDWKNWAQERADIFGLWFGKKEKCGLVRLPSDSLQMELRKLGISNSKMIVVIGEPGGWGEDGRIAWNLLFWGANEVALLDGGYKAWKILYGSLQETGNVQIPVPGDFTFQLRSQRRSSLEEIKKALLDKNRTIIDNRSIKEFHGKRFLGQKRGGRIPGAISVPVDSLYQENGQFIGKENLDKLLPSDRSASVISYCVGGVRSAIFAMLWEARNGEIVSNYDGSIWEWNFHPELPLE